MEMIFLYILYIDVCGFIPSSIINMMISCWELFFHEDIKSPTDPPQQTLIICNGRMSLFISGRYF